MEHVKTFIDESEKILDEVPDVENQMIELFDKMASQLMPLTDIPATVEETALYQRLVDICREIEVITPERLPALVALNMKEPDSIVMKMVGSVIVGLPFFRFSAATN